MQSIVAYLLVTVVATQARWISPGYQMGGYSGYYPVAPAAPVAYHGVPAAVPAVVPAYGYPSFTSTQYHAQDEMGQARFGYAHPGQAASNYRDAMGNQIGSYAYFNPEGKEVRVSYTADHRGFRVLSNDLPVAPVANLVAPVQVPETVEVAQAKAAHFAAHAEANAALAAARAAAAVPVTPVAAADPSAAAAPATPAVSDPAAPAVSADTTKTA